MDKQRQRKLEARTRRQESLHPEMINTKIALVEKKPKVEVIKKDVQPTKAKSNSLPVEIKAKKIILFDDVYTTGRTLLHAMDVLNAYHPSQISTVSLAR